MWVFPHCGGVAIEENQTAAISQAESTTTAY
jgi:hypothetical protein